MRSRFFPPSDECATDRDIRYWRAGVAWGSVATGALLTLLFAVFR